MPFLAASFAAGAVWRALVALHHYQSSLKAADDPSIQELEQVGAVIEGGIALILLAHGGALLALSRRPLQIRWPYALGVALVCAVILSGSLLGAPLVCAVILSGSLLGAPLISLQGVYPALIVASVSILSHVLRFSWVSLYLGSLAGSVLAWYVLAPVTDVFASLFVVGPCVALAFLGAGLRLLVARLAGADSSDRQGAN
jgi:hypothetical protein